MNKTCHLIIMEMIIATSIDIIVYFTNSFLFYFLLILMCI